MSLRNFGRQNALLGLGAGNTVTGTTLSCTPVFDLTGFDGAVCLLSATVTATNNFLVAQVGTVSGTLSDVAGAGATAHTTAIMLEVVRPTGGRFINFQYRQGTSGRHSPLFVFGVNPRALPTTHTTDLTYRIVNARGTGTASAT